VRPSSCAGVPWTFNLQLLTVEGPTAKSRQTRHVELNEEAVSVLRLWREQSGTGARVFGVTTRFQTAWEKVLKRARISKFRWHDLRHHFASRLVQQGAPLNTVRDLLGHGSVGMSLRYAHLAPDQPINGAKPFRNSIKGRFSLSPCAFSGTAFRHKGLPRGLDHG
jgi:integrase